MRTNFGKLVRDAFPVRIQNQGAYPIVRQLSDTEFLQELKTRLIEESWEVYYAQDAHSATLHYAELFEVLSWMMRTQGISPEEIFHRATAERQDRGGFSERCYLVAIEDSPMVAQEEKTG